MPHIQRIPAPSGPLWAPNAPVAVPRPQAAQQDKTDILVLGTHGRSGVMRALLGRVAARVVATASCRVLTVRMPAEARR
jgi:nucleotide-binding universal stress UspA family protein